MHIKDYNQIYSDDISSKIGYMLSYIHACNIDIELFYDTFICSPLAYNIENKNIKAIIGCSGSDFTYQVINYMHLKKHPKILKKMAIKIINYDEYYWFGYMISKYLQLRDYSFVELNTYLPIKKGILIYDEFKDKTFDDFTIYMDELISTNNKDTNLKKLRNANGLSQSELSAKANVTIRSIQMYEQRHNDINKAQYSNLVKLAEALNTNVKEICE